MAGAQSEPLPSLEELFADFDTNQAQSLSSDMSFAAHNPAGPLAQPLQQTMPLSGIFPSPQPPYPGPQPAYFGQGAVPHPSQLTQQNSLLTQSFPPILPDLGPCFAGLPEVGLSETGPFDQWHDTQFLPSNMAQQPVEPPQPLDFDLNQINPFGTPFHQQEASQFQFSARQQHPQFEAPAERPAYSGDLSGETFMQRGDSNYLDSWGQSLTSRSTSVPENQADQGLMQGMSIRSPAQMSSGQDTPKAPRRRGRPRLYDTTVPTVPEAEGEIQQEEEPARKKRGAKPKYKYKTEAEAVANRRERNRKTAISSYYKRKHRDQDLEDEVSRLEREQGALLELDRLRLAGAVHSDALLHHLERGDSGVQILEMVQHPAGH